MHQSPGHALPLAHLGEADALHGRCTVPAARRNSKARRETMLKVLRLDDEQDENGKYVNIPPDNMPLDVEVGEQMITVHQVRSPLSPLFLLCPNLTSSQRRFATL